MATDEEISIVDLVRLCAQKMGINDSVIEFKGYRESDPERRLLSTEKIRERTGWKPIVGLDEGISECIGNYLKDKREMTLSISTVPRNEGADYYSGRYFQQI